MSRLRSLGTGLSVVSLRSTRLLEKLAASFVNGEDILKVVVVVEEEEEGVEGVEGEIVGFQTTDFPFYGRLVEMAKRIHRR